MNYRKRFGRAKSWYFHAWTPDGWRRWVFSIGVQAMRSRANSIEVGRTRGIMFILHIGPLMLALSFDRRLAA